ncbi:23S rRNA (pseudouridine(1915)-N(3))-methyltransferase RlmH [Parasulfitobacter algicola]|uniref:Ribosomal RNA large subunit methyltransferase H n=1 Tax=Parasulfitobacter algicola TaxID=2614809 RepID=A0ABX2IZ33_9RHOB|nr:23S rRNA (pseudouridine(1915)-N(3))-methyltransferase RlmH [Sulfitobacter algicola]NSX55858.1 23S rRNA (pseudouridine(1915)-N(3))-methyltransferase RlmH [Sulfitobacter algicola]
MKVQICAVGRLRTGPEKDLLDDYLTRFERSGRALSLGPCQMLEVEDKKGGGMSAEAELLGSIIPDGAHICALDERGKLMSSPDFAQFISTLRDDGCRDLAFVIGGADGLTPNLRNRANSRLSFGKMVWPHMLARVMLSEQLYRAASILAGSPYHRV